MPQTDGRYVAVKAVGELTDEDYREFTPTLDAIMRQHGSIRLLVDLTEFRGWTPRAAWDDFSFGLHHRKDLERLALVGDAKWQDMAARTAGLLTHADVRHFASEDWWIAWDFIADFG